MLPTSVSAGSRTRFPLRNGVFEFSELSGQISQKLASAFAWGVTGMAVALWAPQAPEPSYERLTPSGATVAPRLLWCAGLFEQHRGAPTLLSPLG
eukprot:gene10436-biopygen13845